MRIVDGLDDFAAYRIGRGMSVSGTVTYARLIRTFADWLDQAATIDDVQTDLIIVYQAEKAETCTPKTVGLHLSAIRAFCRWCLVARLRIDDPTLLVIWPKLPKRKPRSLKAHELRALHAALERLPARDAKSRRMWLRNRRTCFIMLYAGLRLAEVAALDWDDVDLEGGFLTVVQGKGGKDRTIPICRILLAELARVPLAARVGAVCGHKDGRFLTEKSLAHVFERWLPDRNCEGVSAHRLRHEFATSLRRTGADLEDIRRLLGHDSLETTQIYLGDDAESLREAVERLPAPPVQRFRKVGG